MGRLLGIILAMTVVGSISFAQEQTMAPPQKIRKQPSVQVEKVPSSTSNTIIQEFTCRRCGGENHFEWDSTTDKKTLELIPHCQHCGKKYWPKFKPSGFLERIYCANPMDHQLPG